MALVFVQKDPNTTIPAEATGVASLSTTFDSDTASGNLATAVGTSWISGTAPTMTFSDNKSNSWSVSKTQLTTDNAARVSIGYAKDITGGATHQITVTPATTCDLCLGAYEISSADTSSPENGTNSAQGSSTAPSSGSVSPTGNNYYLGGMCYTGSATTMSLNWSGATELHNEPDTAYPTLGSAYYVTTGSQTAAWTLGASHSWAAAIVAYKEAAAIPPDYGTPYDHTGTKPWSLIWRPARM